MSETVIENLITKLSFDFDEKTIEKFQSGIKGIAKGMTAVVGAAVGAQAAIGAFTNKVASANDELGKLSQEIGVDLKAMQELGHVAELNGGSVNSMNDSLRNLSKIASEAARGVGSGVEVFGMLGLSATDAEGKIKSADTLLLEISDSVKNLGTQAERLEFSSKLGINRDLLLSIQQGSEGISKQRAELQELRILLDRDAVQAAADYNDEMLRMKTIIKGVGDTIGTRLMKQAIPMIKMFQDWFKVNKKLIEQRLIVFLDTIKDVTSAVLGIAFRLVGVVDRLAQAMGGWKIVIIEVSVALMALNARALLIPLLIAASAVAIILMLEDVQKFADGADSALGDLTERFPAMEKPINGLVNGLGAIAEGWRLIFTEGGQAFDDMLFFFDDMLERLAGFRDEMHDNFIAPINKAIEAINRIPGVNFGLIEKFVKEEAAPVAFRPQQAVPGTGIGGGQNITNVNNTTSSNTSPTISLNINGGDTQEVRRVVNSVLTEQYQSAQQNFSTGVR